MSIKYSWIILVFSFCIAISCLIGDESFTGLSRLRVAVEQQRDQNLKLQEKVYNLRHEVKLLQEDPRTIEKAARSTLGVAKSDELVFVFK